MAKKKLTVKNKLPELREQYDSRSLYPWVDIRTDYIEGAQDEDGTVVWPTPAQLVEKYDIPLRSLENRITRERWADHRKAHQNQIAVERQKETAKRLAKKAVKFDEDAVEIASKANELILKRLKELEDLSDIIEMNKITLYEKVENGEYVSPSALKASAFSGSELESLMKAFALSVDSGRKALGLKDGDKTFVQNNTTEVMQVNISEELTRTDHSRVQAMMNVLNNPNFKMQALENRVEDIEEAEVIEEDEEFTGYEDGSE